MLSMSGHKGAGCVPSSLHGRRRGVCCMDGMLSAQGFAATGRLNAMAMLCNKYSVYQCRSSLYSGQHQQRLWKRWANLNRAARRTVRVSAMPHLLPVTSTFGVWAALNLAAALGLWSERTRHAPTRAPLCLQCTEPHAGCAFVLSIKNNQCATCTCVPGEPWHQNPPV